MRTSSGDISHRIIVMDDILSFFLEINASMSFFLKKANNASRLVCGTQHVLVEDSV